jgi:DNA-binding SARP family transcriptional activator
VIGVRVLGPLEVTVDGVPADLGGPRQRCVLARLIAARGRVVSADRLIEDLYADEAPPRALAALQAYVSHLRRALEPGRPPRAQAAVLITSPPGYAVKPGSAVVDAWSFDEQVHQLAGPDDPAAAHARLSSALASWRGAAYQEFGGLPWADLEASRLDELRLMATEQLAHAAMRLGRAAEVVPDLDIMTAEHPLREEAWRLLALALYQTGRQGDALAVLRRARARLAEELGVDPGPALRDLEAGILTQAAHLSAPALSPPRRQPAAAPAPPADGDRTPAGTAPFVGRAAELAQLTRLAHEVSAGRLRIALMTGEAGAGKTALAGRLSQLLAAEGWTVTAGRCPEHAGAPPGWAWAEALRQLARTAPPTAPQALDALLTDAQQPEGGAAAARFRLHQAVAAYLETVSRTAPLLVVLDDLHRADGETLTIFAGVAADLTQTRILVLATYRPAEVSEHLSGCLAALAAREPARVALGGLDATAAGELIRATCTSPVDGATERAITERTSGNPFFLKETARLFDSEGALAASSAVPAGVRDVLERRIARLPATAQTVIRQAAVIGIQADIDVLSEMAGVEEHVLLDAIEAGLLTGLVTEPTAGQIRFAHVLVRDTLYDSLSRLRRSRLHARAAQALERHNPGDVAALAHHFGEAAADPVKSTRYCRLAAAQAEQRFGYHEAARLWEQAIASLDKTNGAQVRDRLDLALRLVGALAHTEQLGLARSYRRDAIRAAEPLDDPRLLAQVITSSDAPRAWYPDEYLTTDDELVDTVERTLARLPSGDEPLRCRLLTTLAFELDGNKSERGYQASTQALEMARRLADPTVLTMAINARVFQSFRHDGLAERRILGAELLALPGKPVIAEVLARLILVAASCGYADFSAGDVHAREAQRLADRYDLLLAAPIRFYRALRTALAGDMPAAADLYHQAAAHMDRLGTWQHGAFLSIMGRFCLHIMQGRAGESSDELELVYRHPLASSLVADSYALTLAASGRIDEARAVAARFHAIRHDMFWLFRTTIRGLLAIALDERERARSAYQALLPFAARPVGADTGVLTLWPAAQILGDLASYLGLPDARAHYEHALAIADRAGAEPWRAAALSRLT